MPNKISQLPQEDINRAKKQGTEYMDMRFFDIAMHYSTIPFYFLKKERFMFGTGINDSSIRGCIVNFAAPLGKGS